MIILVIVLIILCLALIYSIFKELFKRKRLGNIIMKVKLDYRIYLLILLFVVVGIGVVYLTIYRLNQYIQSDYYGAKEISWLIVNNTVYLLVLLKLFIRVAISREIREKGMTLTGIAIEYTDIRGLHWLSENKILINYDPNIVYIFNRQFKEKWIVKENQIAELEQHLNERCYESLSCL